MRLQPPGTSRLRHTAARGLRVVAGLHRNQLRPRGRYSRPQPERAIARSRGNGTPGDAGTTLARPGLPGASGDGAPTRRRGRRHATQEDHRKEALQISGPGHAEPARRRQPRCEPPLHIRRLAVLASHRETHRSGLFSALVTAADRSPLRPGTADIIATIPVLGDDLSDYLAPGEQFALLSGVEVGHGVVTRQLFT